MHTRHVSPSQLVTWAVEIDPTSACKRKWAFSRIRPRHETEPTKFGGLFHHELEVWLKTGTAPNAEAPHGKAAYSSIPFIPKPGTPGMEVERELHFVSDGNRMVEFEPVREKHPSRVMHLPPHLEPMPAGWVWYHGFVDVADDEYLPDTVRVIDHKSTGNLKNADKKDLRTDPQRIMYGFHGAKRTGKPNVLAQWQYTERKGANKTLSKTHTATAAETAIDFLSMHRKYGLPLAAAYGTMPLDVEPNVRACGAYGGCEFREECHPTIPRLSVLRISLADPIYPKTQKHKEHPNMSLADDLAASGLTGTTPTAAPAFAPEAHEQDALNTLAKVRDVKNVEMGNLTEEQFIGWMESQMDAASGLPRYARVVAFAKGVAPTAVVAAPAATVAPTSIGAAAPAAPVEEDTRPVNATTGALLAPRPEELAAAAATTPDVIADAEEVTISGTKAEKNKKVLAIAGAAGSIAEAAAFVEKHYTK